MKTITSMDTPALATETAQRWKLSQKPCPECHGATYDNVQLGALALHYSRCPNCRLNFLQLHAILPPDRVADEMLDELARRTPLIHAPNPSRITSSQ